MITLNGKKNAMTKFNTVSQAQKAKSNPEHELCNWFLLCARIATDSVPHPILGDVQTCEACAKFARG